MTARRLLRLSAAVICTGLLALSQPTAACDDQGVTGPATPEPITVDTEEILEP